MRSSLILSFAAVLTLVVGARAEDSYTIKLKHAPDVGKTVTVTDTDTRTALSKATDSDGNVLGDGKKHTFKTQEVYTETVLEKGDKTPNKYKRTYEKATRTMDDKTEARSYEGRTLIFEKKGDKYTVTAEGDKPVNENDLKELTAKANENTSVQDEVFLPTKAIKVGDTWKIDGKKLADVFPGGSKALDPEKSSGEGKLTKVYEKDGHKFGVMTLTFKMALNIPMIEFEKTPIMEMKLNLDTAIDGSSTAGVVTSMGNMATKGTVNANGKKLTIEIEQDLSGKKTQSADK